MSALHELEDRINDLEAEVVALTMQRDETASVLKRILNTIGVSGAVAVEDLVSTVHELRRDAEHWRALAQHSGPAHDAVHALEQALSGLHRALHEGLGHPSKEMKT